MRCAMHMHVEVVLRARARAWPHHGSIINRIIKRAGPYLVRLPKRNSKNEADRSATSDQI